MRKWRVSTSNMSVLSPLLLHPACYALHNQIPAQLSHSLQKSNCEIHTVSLIISIYRYNSIIYILYRNIVICQNILVSFDTIIPNLPMSSMDVYNYMYIHTCMHKHVLNMDINIIL